MSRLSWCNSGAIGMKQGGKYRDNRRFKPYIWDSVDTMPPYIGHRLAET